MKKRIDWIDAAKGLGMLSVVLSHIYTQTNYPEIYMKPIRVFYMPLFFILSGLVAKPIKTDYLTFFKKISYSYLLPAFIFAFLFIPIEFLYYHENINNILKNLTFYTGRFTLLANPAWFLLALFQTVLIFQLLKLGTIKNIYKILTVALCFLAGYAINNTGIYNYYGLLRIPTMLGFYTAGNIIGSNYQFFKSFVKKNLYTVILISLIFFAVGILFNKVPSMLKNTYNNYILFLSGSFGGSFILFYLAYLLRQNKYLQTFGKNTLFVLCTQKLIYYFILNLFFSYLPQKYHIFSAVLCYFLIIGSANPICDKLKIYCPVLLGKRKHIQPHHTY